MISHLRTKLPRFAPLALVLLVSLEAGATEYGVIAGGNASREQIVTAVKNLGAQWIRLNCSLDGKDQPFTVYLDTGVNVIVTINNRQPGNVDESCGRLRDWPNAGFPFRDRTRYIAAVKNLLRPALLFLSRGRKLIVQCENEIGDARMNPKSKYWRGTNEQYLEQLRALRDAVRSLDSSISVALTGFPSESLDAMLDPANPHHAYAENRLTMLLKSDAYDLIDLHFYGCPDAIGQKVDGVLARARPGTRWITTENGGPDPRCAGEPAWEKDPARYEARQAEELPIRFSACAERGAEVCLWFSFFDLNREVAPFQHMGLVERKGMQIRRKPAFEAFRRFVAAENP